jgi:hypothetical protein
LEYASVSRFFLSLSSVNIPPLMISDLRHTVEECHKLENSSSMNLQDLGLPLDYRPRQCSALWQAPAPGWRETLFEAIEKSKGSHRSLIFFRADDIGAGGRAFEALCLLFRHHQVPLAMSVVPAWLSAARREILFKAAPIEEPLWGWHQHGWRHVNWQKVGKKSEFGDHRPFEKQWRDIWQGRQKMQFTFGDYLLPVFTPPWNRLSPPTMKILQQLEFKGVSLHGLPPRGGKPSVKMKNLRIHLDLHTRKEKDPTLDFKNLSDELTALFSKREPSGIMIHHQRMTPFAFLFLDALLQGLKRLAKAHLLSFAEILETGDGQ